MALVKDCIGMIGSVLVKVEKVRKLRYGKEKQ